MEDIGKSIMCTSLSIRRFIDSVLESYGLKSSQGRILKYIENNSPVTASSIESYFNLTKATVSDHLNSLESLKYIERKVDEIDARKKLIVLTNEGKIINEKIKKCLKEHQLNFSLLLSEEEKKLMNNILEKINKKIKEELDV